jgi:hypothetical protein
MHRAARVPRAEHWTSPNWRRRNIMMQRTDIVALVTGVTVGLGGGTLGAFLVCTAGQVVVHRFLAQFDDQYLDLGQPALPVAWQSAQQVSLGGVPVTQQHRDQFPRTVPVLSRA